MTRQVSTVYSQILKGLLVLALAALTVPAHAQSPVAWWMFDDGSGTTATDSSGNGHPMTLVNGVNWTAGRIAGAVSANGTNQYLNVPAIDLSGTNAVTVAFWLNHTYSTVGGHVLLEDTANYNSSTTGFGIFPDDNSCSGIQAAVHGNVGYTANCFAQPTSGVWHHLAFVFDKSQTGAAEVKFYLDGVLQTSSKSLQTSNNTGNFGNNPIYLFSRGGTGEFTAGGMDDLRIFNSALTATAIQTIYSAGTLTSLAVAPGTASITKGSMQQFTATGTYADGSTHNLNNYSTWSSTTPSVGTISASGVATGVAPGSTTVTANASSSISGTATLTVTPAALVSIAVTPANPLVVAGNTQQFTAMGTYSDGSTQNLTSTAVWTSSNTTVATINAGLATTLTTGSTTITATSGSITGSTNLTVTPTLVSIAVAPASPSIAKGATQQFTATGTYSDGSTQNLTSSASWTSTNTAVVTVSAGLATAIATGSTTINATSGSISGSASLTVTPATLVSLAVTPASVSIVLGAIQQFTATGTYSDGSTQNLTSTAVWTSSNTTVATTNAGLATAVAVGSTNIQATSGSINGSTSLTVTPQITGLVGHWTFDEGSGVTAGDSSGNGETATLVNGVSWVAGQIGTAVSANASSSQAVNIPAINLSGTNAVTVAFWLNHTYSTAGGHVLLENTANYNSSTTGFIVLPDDDTCKGIQAAVHGNVGYTANCFVQPSSGAWHHLAFVFDKSQTGAAQVKFFLDGVLQTAGSLLASNNTGNFGNNPTYLFSRGGTQLFTSAQTDDLRIYNSALSQSQVQGLYNGAMLLALSVTPASASIPVGATQQFAGTGTYGDGTMHNVTNVTWSSSTGSASINSTGQALGVAQGTTNIAATLGSIVGSTQLTVTPPTLVGISVSPANPSINKGATQQFTATGTYSDGSTQNITSTVSWVSKSPSVASISTSGLATGLAAGTATIQASSGTILGPAQITVTLPLVSIAITPPNSSIAKGTMLQLTATGTYSDGSTQNLTSSVVWSSTTSSVSTITTGGLTTGVGVGSTTINAVSGTITGTTGLTVTAPTLVSLAVTPANTLQSIGTTEQFTATGTYTDGSTQNLSGSSTWTSSNTSVATINNTGLVTAVTAGGTTISAVSGTTTGFTSLSVVSGSFPWIPYDMWIDFEHDTVGAEMSATELAASTHGTAGAWTVSDPSGLLSTQLAGEDIGHAVTGDTGTRGMTYNLGVGSVAMIQWALPTAQSSLSFGLWYKTGQPAAWTEGPHAVTMYNWGTGTMLRLSDERSSATNARQIRVSPLNVAVSGITDNTWYWLTMKWTQNGPGTFNVYDSSLNLVGTVNFTDTFNSPLQAFQLGNTSGTPGETGITTYFDDFIVDYTHGNFPLLPQIPASLNLVLNPATVTNGNTSAGTLTLSAPAPSGGATITLSSSSPTVASVPPNVTIPAGMTSASFAVSTGTVTFSAAVTITAAYGSLTANATVTVLPATMAQVANDNFNRSNAPTLGSNWTPLLGTNDGALQIVGGQVQSTALSPAIGKEMYYGGLTWGADQYSEAQIVAAGGNGYEGPAVRMTSNDTHYACVVYNTGVGNASIAILLDIAGNNSVLTNSTTANVNPGDTVRCSIQANVITMTNQTASSTLLSVTDSSIISGYPGLVDMAGSSNVANYTLANWDAGDVAAPMTLVQVASDNFNRADSLNLGPNWHVGTGHGPLQIISQQIEPYPAGGTPPSKEHYFAAGPFPNDQWSQLQIVVEDALGDNAVELRASDTADTLYVLDVNLTGAAGVAETRIASVINSTITPLVIDTTWSAVNPGDYIRGEARGNLISLIDVTTGTLLLTVTDSTVTSGYPGISMQVLNGGTPDHVAGNWSGGKFQ
jgi:uncharacterized protein YjdB